MTLFELLARDTGTYAALVNAIAGIIAYRANKERAVNRYFAVFSGILAYWQICVALARTTRDYAFWGTLAGPLGTLMLLMVYLIGDAVVNPHDTTLNRLKKSPFVFVVLIFISIGILGRYGWVWSMRDSAGPMVFLRAVAGTGFLLIVPKLYLLRFNSINANRYEAIWWRITAVTTATGFILFLVLPPAVSSRVLSILMLLSGIVTIALQATNRLFDFVGIARILAARVLAFLLYAVLCVVGIKLLYFAGGDMVGLSVTAIGVACAGIGFALFFLTNHFTEALLRPVLPPRAHEAQKRALSLTSTAETEVDIVNGVVGIVREYVRIYDVKVHLLRIAEDGSINDPLASLATNGVLTPERVLRSLRGHQRSFALEMLKSNSVAALIRQDSKKHYSFVLVLYYVNDTFKPPSSEVLSTLQQIAALSASGIDRVRAIEQSFRSRGLALVGRMAAQVSHEARNQLEAIKTALEMLQNGEESELSPEFRREVYRQAVFLSENHNMALEMTRLRPDRVKIETFSLLPVLTGIASMRISLLGPLQGATITVDCPEDLYVAADARMIRHVLLNLVRNSAEACKFAAIAPLIVIRASVVGVRVHIEISDNGPGVPEHLHDLMFSAWATSKPDGTGLGLPFCVEATRMMSGDVAYVTPRGQPNACFRVSLPLGRVSPSPTGFSQAVA